MSISSINDVDIVQAGIGAVSEKQNARQRYFFTLYGGFCYLLFIAVCFYLVGFLLESVPKSINSGPVEKFNTALVINTLLILAFGFFLSLMARAGFKRIWTRIVPQVIERSTYVLQSSLFLVLLIWQWRPIPNLIWFFDGYSAMVFYTVFIAGVIIVVWSTVLIDHLELFGLRQVWNNQIDQPMLYVGFTAPALYRIVRHPMQFGTLILFWATPMMTAGHALLAGSMTLYVLIGLQFEERVLARQFGEDYAAYQFRVPMLIPAFRFKR